MIVIIDGCDLSGKTYAIERIAKKLNSGFILKNAYKPKIANDAKIYSQYWSIINVIIDRSDIVILDRFFPSQAVYSYLRGQDEFDNSEIIALDKYAATMGFKYIYIKTPLNLLKQRYMERGDEHISIDDLEKIKHRYDEFFEFTSMDKLELETVADGWLDKAIKFIKEEK